MCQNRPCRGRRFRGGRGGQRVRVDTGQREMPEAEPDTAVQVLLDAFDRPERLPRIQAFVVAVFEDQRPRRRVPDVVNRLVDRLQDRLVVLPYHVSRHGILRVLL